ncbi:MAG: hypothetical protein HYT37_04535 [Candidatus Sungbacteria bacterium]|nr:hypothetical protein [Candidatus Sungbacteria bacterium]
MKFSKIKFVMITIVCALFALAMGRIFWPPSPLLPMPSAGQMPFFIIISAVEAIAFGVGVAFLALMRQSLQSMPGGQFKKALAGYISIGWLLVSWWPHDNLHLHIGHDIQKLLYIEYGFHVTLVVAGLVLAYLFAGFLMRKSQKG